MYTREAIEETHKELKEKYGQINDPFVQWLLEQIISSDLNGLRNQVDYIETGDSDYKEDFAEDYARASAYQSVLERFVDGQ